MPRSTSISITLLMLLALTGCSKSRESASESANNPSASPGSANAGTAAGPGASQSPFSQRITSTSVVKAAPQPVEIAAGGTAQGVVKVSIQSGYHTNANPPSYPYLKATELDLPDTDDITVDYIYYPNPQIKKFAFAEKPLRVYEGETPLTINLQAAKTAAKGRRTLAAKLHIQACDDQVCYAPGTIEVAIPVTIK